jgi:hypothetical protein
LRFVKQLEKKLAQVTDPEEVSQLQTYLHVAQVDIDYARYFPFMEPYVSLYAGASSGEKDEASTAAWARYLRTARPPMWTVIEKTRDEGRCALEKLQNRQPQSSRESSQQPVAHGAPDKSLPVQKAKGPKTRASTKSRPRRAEVEDGGSKKHQGSDESDGGGFFDED